MEKKIMEDMYSYVDIKLKEDKLFGKEHKFSFDYTDHEHFKQRFLKRFGNINSDRKLKEMIKETQSLNEVERVFSNNEHWKIKIMRGRY